MAGDALALALGLAGVGLVLTWLTGRGGYLSPSGGFALSWTPQAIGLGLLTIGAAVYFYGVVTGIAIVAAVMWHEWGHVIAYRVAGHDDARFRLIPLFGGVAISNKRPRDHATDCFVTLMGPGFSVSLVVLLLLAEGWLAAISSPLAIEFRWAAIVTGAINAFNMLPFWPLDGGRALRAMTMSFAPRLAPALTTLMSTVLIVFALMRQMWLLLIFAVMGLGYAKQAAREGLARPPMTGGQAALAGLGYGAILGAHAIAGLPLFRWILQI